MTMKATVAHATIGTMISKCGAGIMWTCSMQKRSPDKIKRNRTQYYYLAFLISALGNRLSST